MGTFSKVCFWWPARMIKKDLNIIGSDDLPPILPKGIWLRYNFQNFIYVRGLRFCLSEKFNEILTCREKNLENVSANNKSDDD